MINGKHTIRHPSIKTSWMVLMTLLMTLLVTSQINQTAAGTTVSSFPTTATATDVASTTAATPPSESTTTQTTLQSSTGSPAESTTERETTSAASTATAATTVSDDTSTTTDTITNPTATTTTNPALSTTAPTQASSTTTAAQQTKPPLPQSSSSSISSSSPTATTTPPITPAVSTTTASGPVTSATSTTATAETQPITTSTPLTAMTTATGQPTTAQTTGSPAVSTTAGTTGDSSTTATSDSSTTATSDSSTTATSDSSTTATSVFSTTTPFVASPECYVTQRTLSITDSATIGMCSNNTVQCSSDGSGGTPPLNVTLVQNGPLSWKVTQGNSSTDSTLLFDICVTQPLYHFSGQYNVTLTVANATGVTSLTLSVTIVDENQAPEFLAEPLKTISIAETTTIQTNVAELRVISNRSDVNLGLSDVIYVWDPDERTGPFGISNVTFVVSTTDYANGTSDASNDANISPIVFEATRGSISYQFQVRDTLVAGSNISVTIQATDKGGLSATSTVVFVISRVNRPPQCVVATNPVTLNVTTASPGSVVNALQCSDRDTANLTYTELLSTEGYEYFNVIDTGVVIIERLLPLNVMRMEFSVRVTDDEGLNTDVSLYFNIRIAENPSCLDQFAPVNLTQTYKGIQCHNVTLNCGHVPGLSPYNLGVNYTFIYNTTLFMVNHYQRFNSNGQQERESTVQICPATDSVDRSQLYGVSVTVSSETGASFYRGWEVGVAYVNQAPRFNQSAYSFATAEMTSVGSTVVRVVTGTSEADWSSGVNNGVYLLDPDTEQGFELQDGEVTRGHLYKADGTNETLSQNSSSGIVFSTSDKAFKVTSGLSARDQYVFNLLFRDAAGAEATTDVNIRVTDVNQAPSCPRSPISVTLNLTAVVGQTVVRVVCTDPDTDPIFSNLTYSMSGIGLAASPSHFSIDPITGDVKLTSQLPTLYDQMTYNVTVRDGGMLTSSVIFSVHINRNHKPHCTPISPINVTFQETNASGACTAMLVTCVDTSGRNLPLSFDVNYTVTSGYIVIIDDSQNNPNTTVFKACVGGISHPALLPVEKYQLIAEVSNSLRVTSVIFNVNVVDVNQPPKFEKSLYTLTVPETIAVGTTVAIVRSPSDPPQDNVINIVRSDPDTVTQSFLIQTLQYAVGAEYVNGTEYDVSRAKPIDLNSSKIVVVQRLKPDVIYFCSLTVTDGEGLSANATLRLNVIDVNEAPVCLASTQLTLDLLHPLYTHNVISLPILCGDLDYNVVWKTLRYFAYPENDASYFNVSENGDVTLVTSIPRDTLLLTLQAYAVDGGGLRDNMTIYFNISRHHPPQCYPAYVPPDGVWETDTCFRIYPNCSDPLGDASSLSYVFSGTWNTGFYQSVSPNATHHYAEFCYLRASDGNYTVRMNVTNGLGMYAWQANVRVSYRDAPPKFTVNRYISEVNETERVGFPVLRVEALVDGQNASLVYSLTGSGGLNKYFSINSSSGQISVSADLSPLVGTETTGQVAVTHPRTGLSHSIPLKIKVLDVNQPPTCQPASLTTTIAWGVKVTDTVATLNCSDPDPTPGFSRLTYSVVVGMDTWRMQGSEIRLLSRALLEPDRSQYTVIASASDGAFTASVTVVINVDLTPPKPAVILSDVRADSANISWVFDDAYLPVIDRFTVVLFSNSANLRRHDVSKNVNTYVITNLTSERQYSVHVTVYGRGSNLSSDTVVFTTSPIANLSEACTELHLVSKTWNDNLSNNQSQEFRTLQHDLTQAVKTRLQRLPGFVSSTVRSFRSGSVFADVLLTTNQSLDKLKSEVIALVTLGSLSGIPINASYSPFYRGGAYIVDVSVAYTSKGKIVNAQGVQGYDQLVSESDVTATCTARTPGAWNPVFEWRLDNRDISSLASGLVRATSDNFRVTSTVSVGKILQTGNLTCRVRTDTTEVTGEVSLVVVSRVTARLSPPTAVVTSGINVTLTCERTAGYDANWTAVFYSVDGNAQKEVDRRQVDEKQKTTELQLNDVTSGQAYRCDVSDPYGGTRSNNATIIIKSTAGAQCPEDDEWPSTPAGNIVQRPCPANFSYDPASVTRRTCSAEGQWGQVDSSQCVRRDLKRYKELIDSAGATINTTWEVMEEVANSTSGPLLTGDVITVAAILNRTVTKTQETNYTVQSNNLQDFVRSANNMLQAPTDVWANQTPVALQLVHNVDTLGKAAAANENITTDPIQTNKIVLEVGKAESGMSDIEFPDNRKSSKYPGWIYQANSSVFLSKNAFPDNVKTVRYSAVIYTNLTNVFSSYLNENLTGQSDLFVNSPILAISLHLAQVSIQQPVRLSFRHTTSNFSNPTCQFLNFSASENGVWSRSGCRVSSTDSDRTVCLCDHLTNFAVLMSPYRTKSPVVDVLNIFSIVGCAVSIVCLLLTLIIYRVFWRFVKSDRSVILMNLCVILILAYVAFLAGVNRVEYETVCTVVAVLLHYLWLVVFCLMLCEGLDIFISIVIIFPTKSVLLKLLLMAYGVPLVIVGASMGITQLEGYGGPDFCWLSLKNNLLWAFVGPALAALLANFVFVALVIRALLSTTAMITKANRERARSVVRAICVMTPILGLAWIFGVMAVNDDTLLFQVLFVVFNSLQGLMIFIFHCLLSKQVREGFQNSRRQRKASAAKYSADSAASRYVSQKRTSESSMSSNDLGKSTSPFIQADRQVQRMATKMSLLDNPNFLTSNDPPKVAALKDPVAGTTGSSNDPPKVAALKDPVAETTWSDLGDYYFNIRPNDPGPGMPTQWVVEEDPSFRIESGNLTSFSPSPQPSSIPSNPPPTTAATTTRAVVEKESLRQTHSLEDNEQQADIPMNVLSLSHSGPGGRGDHYREGMSNADTGDNLQGRGRSQKSLKKSTSEGQDVRQIVAEQQSRLDHVYGIGARVSTSPNPASTRPYVKAKGGRVTQSADSVPMTSHNDAKPSTSPKQRWHQAARAIARHHHPHHPARRPTSRSPTHYQSAFPHQQASHHPSSPRRMSTSADGMDPSAFPLFSGPRHGEVHYVSGKRQGPPPQPGPKPSGRRHHEPPVDYW